MMPCDAERPSPSRFALVCKEGLEDAGHWPPAVYRSRYQPPRNTAIYLGASARSRSGRRSHGVNGIEDQVENHPRVTRLVPPSRKPGHCIRFDFNLCLASYFPTWAWRSRRSRSKVCECQLARTALPNPAAQTRECDAASAPLLPPRW